MSQSARILVLYQRLMAGKVINKAQLALEFETTERSIDRDILAIRLFLSDSFSGLDLVYDRKLRGYKLKNLRIKQDIGIGECYLLTKLLLGNQAGIAPCAGCSSFNKDDLFAAGGRFVV